MRIEHFIFQEFITGQVNAKILQWFAEQYDLSKLDHDQDGEVDLIALICRARFKFGFHGNARLYFLGGGIVNRNQIRITEYSGIYQTDCYSLSGARQIVTHEIGHCLGFGHINGLYRWSLMSSPRTGVTMSAYEMPNLIPADGKVTRIIASASQGRNISNEADRTREFIINFQNQVL